MKRTLLLPLLLAGTLVSAQSGIRFSFLNFESITKRWNSTALIGYDRDLNDRLSIGIDLVKSFRFEPEGNTRTYEIGGMEVNYNLATSYIGFQYRCSYFYSGSGYVATTVGFRSVDMALKGYTANYTPGGFYETVPFRESDATMLFPLGLRLGFRSDMDGYFGDIHVGIGTLLGNKDLLKNSKLLDKRDGIATLWLQAGYTMGIGW
jgi:hypothetical protein